jgi:outer membrane protein
VQAVPVVTNMQRGEKPRETRMILGRILVVGVTILSLNAALAQDEPAPTPTPNLGTVRLLEDVPNFAAILSNQWSEGVGAIGTAAENDWENYGRLIDTGPPTSLSVSDCIVLALKHNTGLQVERLGPLSARAGVRKAQSIFDPALFGSLDKERAVAPSDVLFYSAIDVEQNLNANLGLRKVLLSGGQAQVMWTNRRYFTNSPVQEMNPDYVTSLSLSVNQPLLRNFGLHYATILVRIAKTAELQALRAYEARAATIVKNVEDAYWGLVRAMEGVRVQEQALEAGKELERQNRGKFEVGALPRTAVLEAESVVAQRQSLLIAVQNAVTIARDNLRALLNARSPETDALILLEPSERPSVEPAKIDLESSLQVARESRPELQVAQLDVHVKALALKAAENQVLPNLDAVGAIGLNGLAGRQLPLATPNPENPFDFSALRQLSPFAGGYGESLNLLTDGRFYSYTAGVVLNIPIANAQSRADYATARINLERSRLNFAGVQQQVTLEVKTSISNLETDLKSIDSTRVARELAEENVRNQQARYDVGLATTKDLLDFQDQQTRARVAEILAVIQYNTDLAELRRVEGTLLRTRNVVLDVVPEEKTPWWARF